MSQLSRSRTRKFLYQYLFAQTFSQVDLHWLKQSFFEGIFETKLDEEYLSQMHTLIIENQDFLLEVMKKYAPKFDIKSMEASFILPIFIGCVEMMMFPWEIPSKVSINEATEIAKVYWDDASKKMVNGVLHKICLDLEDLKKDLAKFDVKNSQKKFFY